MMMGKIIRIIIKRRSNSNQYFILLFIDLKTYLFLLHKLKFLFDNKLYCVAFLKLYCVAILKFSHDPT